MSLTAPTIIRVLAASPRWPTTLERIRPLAAAWNLQAVADWPSLVTEVLEEGQSLSIIEVELELVAEWLRRIEALCRWSANHRVAVVGRENLRPAVEPLREAGALWVGTSLGQQRALLKLIERYAARFAPQSPSLRDAVFAALPWTPSAENITMEPTGSDGPQNPPPQSSNPNDS